MLILLICETEKKFGRNDFINVHGSAVSIWCYSNTVMSQPKFPYCVCVCASECLSVFVFNYLPFVS